MSKKSTELIVNGVKKYGPTVGKFALDHKKRNRWGSRGNQFKETI